MKKLIAGVPGIITTTYVALFNLAIIAHAGSFSTQSVRNPLTGFTSLTAVANFILNLLIGVGFFLTAVFLIWGGIQYIMSKGDTKAATTARDTITNSIIGLVIVIGALAIRQIAISTLGANVDSTDNPLINTSSN